MKEIAFAPVWRKKTSCMKKVITRPSHGISLVHLLVVDICLDDILFRCKFLALAALAGKGSGAGALAALAGKGNTAGASGGGNLAALAALAGKGNTGGGGGGNLAALAALAGKGGLGLVI